MQKIYQNILDTRESQLRDTIWYSLGTICSSATSMVILLIVTRIMGQEMSGIFSLAWSAAQLMLTIGWFNTRQYQVSDVNEEISYYEYFMAKIISSIAMIFLSFVYIHIYNYDTESQKITLALCALMVSEVFADFFAGFFQQNGKLHIGGKSYVVRNVGYLFVFSLALMLLKNIVVSVICAIGFAIGWLVFFDYQLAKRMQKQNTIIRGKNIIKIFVDCFPLFIGLFITSFITNIPKNTINICLDHNAQASYNILFMPTAVINMLNMFICVPAYSTLAVLWQKKERKKFFTVFYKLVGLVGIITGVTLLAGGVVGIPVLSWLYGVDLFSYRSVFMILIIGGGFNGLISILTYIITVFRRQKIIVYIYLICALLAQILSIPVVSKWGVFGAAVIYVVAIGLICVGLIGYIGLYIKLIEQRKGEKDENQCNHTRI